MRPGEKPGADDGGGPTKVLRGTIGPLPGVNWNLTVSVSILMVLVAAAVPAFTHKVKRTRTSEATGIISRIYQTEVAYFSRSHEEGVGQFVSVGATPARAPTATGYPANPTVWTNDPRHVTCTDGSVVGSDG